MTVLSFLSTELCRIGWHRIRTPKLTGNPLAFRCWRCGRVV